MKAVLDDDIEILNKYGRLTHNQQKQFARDMGDEVWLKIRTNP